MAYTEFGIIQRFFKSEPTAEDVILAIGDDTALLQANNKSLYQDSLVLDAKRLLTFTSGTFCAFQTIETLVTRAQALGRTPRWLTLNLILDKVDEPWLESFSEGLHAAMQQFDLTLVGGDTCQGPPTICLNLISF